MALSPEDDLHQQWLQYHYADPLAITAPQPASGAPLLPPAPDPLAPLPEVAAPQPVMPMPMPMPEEDPALHEAWLQYHQGAPLPPPQPVPATAIGPTSRVAPIDPDAAEALRSEPAPEPDVPPGFDPLNPATWMGQQPELAPVGHRRTTAAPGQQSLSADEILQLNPLELARYEAEQAGKLADFTREREAQIRLRDAKQAEEDLRAFQASQARAKEITEAAIADADALANEKPKKYMDSIGNVIGAVMGVFLGQFATNATGGRNVGLDMLNKRMDDFARDQINEYNRKAGNVDRKLNIAAKLRDAGYNEFQTATVIRMAGLQRMRDELLAQQQNFDPRGTQSMAMAKHIRATQSAMAQNAMQLEKDSLEYDLKRTQLAKAQLEVAEKAKKLQGTGAGAGKRPPEYFEQLGLARPPFAMTDKEYDAWQRRKEADRKLGGNDAKSRKEEAEAVKAEAEAEAAKQGYVLKNPETGQIFTVDGKPNGKPLVEMSETKRNRVSDVVTAATRMRALADKIRSLRTKYGGHIKSLGSDEAQEVQSLVSMVDFETFKAFGLGAPSAGDKGLAEGVRGGVDPSSFVRDASKGFLAYADALEEKANTELRSVGYQGPPLKFTRESDLPKPKPTEREQDLQLIIKSDYSGITSDPRQSFGKKFVDPLSEESPENIDRMLMKLVGAARAGDESAWKDIETISTKAISPAIRQRAEALLVERPR